MKILLTGSSGFVGQALCQKLRASGHDLILLKRDLSNFEGGDALIHLGGEPIANERWTAEKKRKIRDSRVEGLKRLSEAIARLQNSKPSVIISASAIGYYGDRADEILDEPSSPGTGFLAEVCKEWEEPIVHQTVGTGRQVSLRLGVVLGHGGALEHMLPIFKAGLGGPVGNGKQWVSWIHIQDLVGLIEFALSSDRVTGVFNAVAPSPVTNHDFSKALAEALGTKSRFPVPAFVLKAALGERSQILLASQRVVPKRFLELGFKYRFSKIEEAMKDLCR